MNKHLVSSVSAATVLLAAGCLPDKSVWWSPDGQTAAVRAPDGLRLTGTNGQLSAVILPGEIQSAAWLPDGTNLVVSRSFKVAAWAEVEKLVPRGETEATLQMARGMPDLLKAGLTASGGSMNDMNGKFLEPLGMTESQALEPAWLCALQAQREQIRAALRGFTNAAELEAEVFATGTNGISVYELSLLPLRAGRVAGESRPLLRSLRPLLDPLPCPRHPVLAFRTGAGALKAMTLEGQKSADVADQDAVCATWSADGHSLAYVVMNKSDKAGEIRSRMVVSDTGELPENAPQAQTLALAIFAAGGTPRLCTLPNGQILFAAVPLELPARAASIHPGARFFLLDPRIPDAPPLAVAIKEGSLPEDLSAFAPSPDGRQIAVVEEGTDAVAVLELATGRVRIISPPHAGWKSRMIPAWRSARELTYAALPTAAASRPELMFWQAGAPERVLSTEWPDPVVKVWLEGPSGGGGPRPR